MKFSDFSIPWPSLRCPYFVIEASPGLPHPPLEAALQDIPTECGTPVTTLLDEHRLAHWLVVPLPFQFPSDGSWWVDMHRISSLMARMVQVALHTTAWQGNFRTGIVTEGNMQFRDENGHWEANNESLPWEWGALLAWKECCSTEEDWHQRFMEMLCAPNNILLPLPDLPNLPPGVRAERAVCFQELLPHHKA